MIDTLRCSMTFCRIYVEEFAAVGKTQQIFPNTTHSKVPTTPQEGRDAEYHHADADADEMMSTQHSYR